MKKKFVALVATGAFILGGTTVYTAGNYYADLLGGQEQQMKDRIVEKYEEDYAHRNQQVHNDLVMYVEQKRMELEEIADAEISAKINNEASERQIRNADAIDAEFERLKTELLEFINNLE